MEGTWTPKSVGEVLVEMVRWCMSSAGPIGPARLRSVMPELVMDLTDRLAEGWSSIADMEPSKKRRSYRPAEVSMLERAIRWSIDFLADHPGPARVLNLWLRCKITKMTFAEEVDRKGWSRATAYRQRDKALSLIAIGLSKVALAA